MAITVKLQDGTVSVGGEFNRALSFVKGLTGRRFDGATRTWTVPMGLTEFGQRCSLPYDVLGGNGTGHNASGNHVTRYGNAYSREEWTATKEARRAESRVADEFAPKFDALKAELCSRIQAAGLSDAAVKFLASGTHIFEIEDLEEMRAIKFSSAERRAAVLAVAKWYDGEYVKLHNAEQDAMEGERERIFEHYLGE